MSLLAQCVFVTEENEKLPMVKECLSSLVDTVNLKKHRWVIINNASTKETEEFLDTFHGKHADLNITILHSKKNIGTARGINKALYTRGPGELCIKTDDDLTWSVSGWVEQLERQIKKHPDIGILGLKRDDVWQNPNHADEKYRTKMEGKLEICEDIFGTCTAYNPLMLDKVGRMIQCSNFYGFDDVLISVRSICAGFRNAFLPHIKIKNLDIVETGYTKWKREHVGEYIDEVSNLCKLYRNGTLNYFYDGE